MDRISLKANAKINLTLDILSKRADGYHEVLMIMQSVSLSDEVYMRKTASGEIRLKTNLPYVPADSRNIAFKAAELFFEETGVKNKGLFINVKKKIPVAAGLAGGSADGAAVLKGLDKLYETGLDGARLNGLAGKLGSDVPFCLKGGTALAGGRGEILTRLKDAPDMVVVICKPPFPVSTAKAYSLLDLDNIGRRPDTDRVIKAIEAGDKDTVCENLINVFEPFISAEHGEICKIKDILLEKGAKGAAMSGSGPSVYGLFDNVDAANAAARALKKIYRDTFVCKFTVKND